MKSNAWNQFHAENMRQRFLKCGIPVNNLESNEEKGGLMICPSGSLFYCRATVYYPGYTRYALSLRLLSDNPNVIIRAFRITSAWEKEIRVLQPFEQVPLKYVDWNPEEKILNNCVGQAVGPTRCREGLLLGEGLRPPASVGPASSASITLWVYDQFDRTYSHTLEVDVVGLADLLLELRKPKKARESLFEHPIDIPTDQSTGGRCAENNRDEAAVNKRLAVPFRCTPSCKRETRPKQNQ